MLPLVHQNFKEFTTLLLPKVFATPDAFYRLMAALGKASSIGTTDLFQLVTYLWMSGFNFTISDPTTGMTLVMAYARTFSYEWLAALDKVLSKSGWNSVDFCSRTALHHAFESLHVTDDAALCTLQRKTINYLLSRCDGALRDQWGRDLHNLVFHRPDISATLIWTKWLQFCDNTPRSLIDRAIRENWDHTLQRAAIDTALRVWAKSSKPQVDIKILLAAVRLDKAFEALAHFPNYMNSRDKSEEGVALVHAIARKVGESPHGDRLLLSVKDINANWDQEDFTGRSCLYVRALFLYLRSHCTVIPQ
jgi:hypothetical protein